MDIFKQMLLQLKALEDAGFCSVGIDTLSNATDRNAAAWGWLRDMGVFSFTQRIWDEYQLFETPNATRGYVELHVGLDDIDTVARLLTALHERQTVFAPDQLWDK